MSNYIRARWQTADYMAGWYKDSQETGFARTLLDAVESSKFIDDGIAIFEAENFYSDFARPICIVLHQTVLTVLSTHASSLSVCHNCNGDKERVEMAYNPYDQHGYSEVKIRCETCDACGYVIIESDDTSTPSDQENIPF